MLILKTLTWGVEKVCFDFTVTTNVALYYWHACQNFLLLFKPVTRFYKPPYLRYYWKRCSTALSVVLNLLFSFTLSTHCSGNRPKPLQTSSLVYRIKLLATLLNRGFFCLFVYCKSFFFLEVPVAASTVVLWLNLSTSSWRPTTFQGPSPTSHVFPLAWPTCTNWSSL